MQLTEAADAILEEVEVSDTHALAIRAETKTAAHHLTQSISKQTAKSAGNCISQ